MTTCSLQAPGLLARGIRTRCVAGLIALSVALPVLAAPAMPSADMPSSSMPSSSMPVTRIAFGSCSKETLPQPIWDAVLAAKPDLFVFLGDNVYGDTRDMDVLRAKYARFGAIDGVRRLRADVPVLATWDDHDFGENDAGSDYPMKEESRRIFLDFWGEPVDSPRRERDGVYTSYSFGPEAKRVQVILLDLRYNRTPIATSPFLDSADDYRKWAERAGKAGREVPGPYVRNADPAATMLGERQWRWLEEQLRQPADIRVIGSSLQVLADFPGWEAWVNYPNDQQRLFRLIRDTGARGVFMISGDTHYGELSRQGEHVPYPLYDLTSSGLTEVWHAPVPNALRQDGQLFRQANFGLIEIDWSERALDLSLRDVRGEPLLRKRLRFDELAMRQP